MEAIIGVVIGTLAFMIVCVVTMTRFCSGAGASGSSSHRHYYTSYRMNQSKRASFALKQEQAGRTLHEEMCEMEEKKEIDV